jgi:hypothetical protein
MKDQGDEGYGSWMNDPDSFNVKHNRALIKYKEPMPMQSACANLGNFYELGNNKIADYSGDNMTQKSLNYMDYRVAHSTHTLVDESLAHRRDYNNLNDLESDRAGISFSMSPAEIRTQELRRIADLRKDDKRKEAVKQRDAAIHEQYRKANKLMLGGKSS